MSNTHYDVASLTPSSDFLDALRALAVAWDKFTRLRGVIIQTKDNAASGDAVYAPVVARFNYAGVDAATKNAVASASFNEIDSAFSVANAAVVQLLNRHL